MVVLAMADSSEWLRVVLEEAQRKLAQDPPKRSGGDTPQEHSEKKSA